ncbi:MAG TPA: PQQ-dependent dehydrogenase, methanol/ethanol family [Phenylobacterium sp.]|jgi:PQQ-dependent dehydrogenase (methanol/ethanol family)|uniref:PQQ-dependent dehydrogenase, methanol/ethanol family n=1 Tax=Phenylobacterium sp. TaxID=1871053 RepID=UPI002D3F6ACD|nr:PQQ-dependent dehydrogenase, methanol/ethanol family [Phenylobacterium sp.]HZZ67461.1 PQQ-dependent dehydrogenase, methanol/ethanol family [Phenylobacterium sp.]
MKNKTSRGVVGLGAAMALILSGPLAAVAQTPASPPAKAAKTSHAVHPYGGAAVDSARLLAADREPGTWMAAGRTYSQQRYSPLTGINQGNVGKLGLAWYGDIDTERGQESTPVVVDGVLYVTTAWSKVKAYDAKTGKKLWDYDPKVDPANGAVACCDVVNRGIGAWKGKIYLGALDGRLIALDGKTGKVAWSVQTTDPKQPYTITQVPRIVKGLVIVGNGGAEYTCRGYVSAYDAASGKLKWRFYTVPAAPGDPTNTPLLEKAAKTWNGDFWKYGGGGTAWDTILYDPKTDLIYFGTGNGLSWSQEIRSPKGGDNLFVSSIIAVHATTGKYAWHFQEVPGDEWDYDVTNPLMTADLKIAGTPRHVLMQAPKTGFFYVWDAATGKLISAEKFAPANWASKIDLKTGRPVENPAVRYTDTKAAIVQPAPLGAHNWHPMSYSPRTGLVYIPVTESSTGFQSAPPTTFQVKDRVYNTGTLATSDKITELYGQPGAPQRGNIRSYLEAYDPVAQKTAWRAPDKDYGPHGTMVTASDIVFSGDWSGQFNAFDARTGKKLWSSPTQADVVAAPSTYVIDGVQYVAVLVGARGLPPGQARTSASSANNSRLLVYALNGTASLPTQAIAGSLPGKVLDPPLLTGTNEQVIDGESAYGRFCAGCHGAGGVSEKSIPDLRYSPVLRSLGTWKSIVIDGARANKGMVSFKKVLAEGQAEAIYHYIVSQANKAKATQQAAAKP